jgi:hypothetical protein
MMATDANVAAMYVAVADAGGFWMLERQDHWILNDFGDPRTCQIQRSVGRWRKLMDDLPEKKTNDLFEIVLSPG